MHSSATHPCCTGSRVPMAVHIFRREATYHWRRRTRHALANFLGRPHVFVSLRTTSPVTANHPRTSKGRLPSFARLVCRTKRRPSERRRIKNAQSKRNIPLHPEVIRLNFLD